MGDWSFNPACFPDPQGMIDQLITLGITFKITFWPFQTPQSKHWDEFNNSGYLATINGTLQPIKSNYYLYDSTNPDARKAVFNAYHEGYGTFGIKTIWLDAAEPERHSKDSYGLVKFQAGTDAEVGEAWIQQHVKTFAEGFASQGITGADYYVLPRHAWAGSWRYSAGLWSGDIQSTFDELAIQIKVAQNVAVSGVALWTTDMGGYWGGDAKDPVFQDLIVRWFQFGAFCPLFRLHGHRAGGPPSDSCGDTNGDNEVWNLAADDTRYNAIAAVMRLREQLRQYVADINLVTATTGMPMVRPMFMAFANDPACQGPDVEVCRLLAHSLLCTVLCCAVLTSLTP
jgi:alpha-D-xyloside xylohydrolase